MTVYQDLLSKGYFPKELPPAFFPEQFARYAVSKHGRTTIKSYKPRESFTECVRYRLALAGLNRRELRIPHPASYANLADLTARNFPRLLKKVSGAGFSRSLPTYVSGRQRALHPRIKPADLARERAVARAGSSYLLKADISQFYSSLYTHAVGWAVDPKLRSTANWRNRKLLGYKLDRALMDLDGKISQGIPIGNDISFLLAELVLARVDKAMIVDHGRSYRWFDDYELAFDTRDQAEIALRNLNKELGKFKLRLNGGKTTIIQLPRPADDEWQVKLREAGRSNFKTGREMVKYFDTAFRVRGEVPDLPVLLYALGLLFKIPCPSPEVGEIAQSCITQALLCEPGAAQKVFALFAFWELNGFTLDDTLIKATINQIILRHYASGFSSDIAWALAFCLEQDYEINSKAAELLSEFEDDCIALQALHMERNGLLNNSFVKKRIGKALKDADLDREHWLVAYESTRHGFLSVCTPAIAKNPLFSDMLKKKVTFYRTKLPPYAGIVHSGGAPEWLIRLWVDSLRETADTVTPSAEAQTHVLRLIEDDVAKRPNLPDSTEDTISQLMDIGGGYSS